MPKAIPESDFTAIEAVLQNAKRPLSTTQISGALEKTTPRRTLQNHLGTLVKAGRLIQIGNGRSTQYQIPGDPAPGVLQSSAIALTPKANAALSYVSQPALARKPAGYDRTFLDQYQPNKTFYLSRQQRQHLIDLGKLQFDSVAGTYSKQILSRLLIDLSWNSSRLEGNTYTLLDTQRLLTFGEALQGSGYLDAQMILNHKDAIEFLVGAPQDIGFNRHTILNLHALLANNLLADSAAAGKIRHIIVGITESTFYPLEIPSLIEECFDQLLATAAAIKDPFEQAFFMMVQLPYLQPFDDVNKRVSRLAANIPLVKLNLAPLSFTEVPRDLYAKAILAVYELRDVSLLSDLFVWAYERSAASYMAVRQSLGEPDPFRLQYRNQLREAVAITVKEAQSSAMARQHIRAVARQSVAPIDQDKFLDIVETELLRLHEGNFARFQIRPSEFAAWRERWKR